MKKLSLLFTSFVFLLAGCTKTADNNSNSNTESNDTTSKEKTFQSIDIKELQENAVSLFADNWFVVTAGDESAFNQMTISWGNLGNVWGYPAAVIYIRTTRHTYPFIDNGKHFTLSAFDEAYRDKVLFIGQHSGRDVNKVEATGLTPKTTALGNIYYDEARLVIECEKIYFSDILPENLSDESAAKMYEGEPTVHRMFIGKIVNVWEKK
ncbi:MAG: flavin reductase [Prevotellaceae bacterium]|jgi:flavin reductase (DIM6/NTAB) family NADH-FMN oxidoreductase RutF|nr:flavin reductase [Prevotellaceae bacterium]